MSQHWLELQQTLFVSGSVRSSPRPCLWCAEEGSFIFMLSWTSLLFLPGLKLSHYLAFLTIYTPVFSPISSFISTEKSYN